MVVYITLFHLGSVCSKPADYYMHFTCDVLGVLQVIIKKKINKYIKHIYIKHSELVFNLIQEALTSGQTMRQHILVVSKLRYEWLALLVKIGVHLLEW